MARKDDKRFMPTALRPAPYAQRLGPEGQSTLPMLANATPPLLLMLLFLRP